MPETSQIPPLSNEKSNENSNQKSSIQENYYFDGFAFYAQTDELVVEHVIIRPFAFVKNGFTPRHGSVSDSRSK